MDTALDLYPGRLHLLLAPSPVVDRLADACIARLALSGPLHVLDGGNRFSIYQIARHIRLHTARLEETLGHIRVARAFTCFQMAALLAGTAAGESPILALRLLTTFYDENIPRSERLRLLRACTERLKRLSTHAPVLVSAAPGEFTDQLDAAADHTWRVDAPAAPLQLRLVEG